jgi:hypothetical protein
VTYIVVEASFLDAGISEQHVNCVLVFDLDCRLSSVGQLYKSPDTNQVPTELIQAGKGDSLPSEIHKFNYSVCIQEELPQHWKASIIVRIVRRFIKLTVVITRPIAFISFVQNCLQLSCFKIIVIRRRNYWGSLLWSSS